MGYVPYVSYLQFFTELKQLIRDCAVEFDTDVYRAYSDNEFNIKYSTFLGRLQKRCKDYSDTWFFGPSRFISEYVDAVAGTKDYPRTARFTKLLELTDAKLRAAL